MTSEPFDLGTIIEVPPDKGVQPPQTFEDIGAALDEACISYDDVANKAVRDIEDTPSIWFVDFPDQAAADQPQLLQKCMQSIQDYRCWASVLWWSNAFSCPRIPQDGSGPSTAARSAYCAKVGVKHMRGTPWLGMNSDNNISKEIDCKADDFHAELIRAVLDGFVTVTPAICEALESILQPLGRAISETNQSNENKMIACSRYEYLPEANAITSYVRLISFSVAEDLKNVEIGKRKNECVKCNIEYNEFDATFNHNLWDDTAGSIGEQQKKAALDFVNEMTIDCAP